jgi:signal transduction histidine kinase
MRTLSARILLGFAILTVTFGVITANVVFNMSKVEDAIVQIRLGYVPLALISKDLARAQDALVGYLDENFDNDPAALRLFHPPRDLKLTNLRSTLTHADSLSDKPRRNLEDLVQRIEAETAEAVPLYAKLATSSRDRQTGDASYDHDALTKLRNIEHIIKSNTTQLQSTLEHDLNSVMLRLEEIEHQLRIYTIYFGLLAVLLGLTMTGWVVITLRPLYRLREAARRVAAGKYGQRIDERGPTEVKDLARELNAMARAVEERERELVRSERLAAVGKMAAMITHEVRNPLSSIGLNTELLEEELGESSASSEAKQLLSAIHREVDRLTAITEEYLAFSRLPKPKVAREPVNKLVTALADFVREDLAVKQVNLALELGDGEPTALIDPAQIRQCLVNLVLNASEAVASKGGGKITVRTRRDGTRVVIEVEDDGTGISPDVLPRLFDPFFSTKESGSGLGLALTQQIVKDHGGDVAVASTLGRGTTFKVSVPAV